MSIDFAHMRIQFDKPIFEQQIIQHYLADMALDTEALRSMTYRVAWMVDQKRTSLKMRLWSSYLVQKRIIV